MGDKEALSQETPALKRKQQFSAVIPPPSLPIVPLPEAKPQNIKMHISGVGIGDNSPS